MPSVAKARISPCAPDGTPSLLQSFEVQFNPSELTIQEAVGDYAYPEAKPPIQAAEKQGESMQRLPGQREHLTLTAKLLFHTYRGPLDYDDVRTRVNCLHPFLNANTAQGQANHISFSWGSIQIYGMLSAMSVTYGMFAPDGTPVRAEVSITITGNYRGEERALSLGGAVSAVSGITGIAAAIAAAGVEGWKSLASAAGIVNPRTNSRV